MMAWYAEALGRFPDGLVTQAQAATMLAVSRMAINRLVAGGYLRALHFPRPADIAGVSVGRDDPEWLMLAGWLGLDPADADVGTFPKACYVALADVAKLWQAGQARAKCSRDWWRILADIGAPGFDRPPEGEQPPPADEPKPTPEEPQLETWML